MKMDKTEADLLAREVLWQFRRCRDDFRGAYDYIAGEIDVSDAEINAAVRVLFPKEYKTL